MHTPYLIFNDWRFGALALAFFTIGRYLVMAGLAYLICYRWLLNDLRRFKIQQALPRKKQLNHEIRYSCISMLTLTGIGMIVYLMYIHGHTTLYISSAKYGTGYFLLCLIGMIIVHDAYFYWTHRLLHTPWLFRKVHIIHHRSVNPTPLAAYCFHPVELLLETLIIFPMVTIFPVPLAAFLVFSFLVLLLNVVGHLGFEFLPARFREGWAGRHLCSSTHHNGHHRFIRQNFGYYFSFWDKLMKTSPKTAGANKMRRPRKELSFFEEHLN